MHLLKKAGEALLLAGVFFLLFLLFFEDRLHLPAWLQVLGRMHPVFLHFPITLLLVYFVAFWIPSKDSSSVWVRVIGFIAALSAVVTATMGLLLSLQGTYEGDTFVRHKWGGIAIALLAFSFYYLFPFFEKRKNIGRPLTILSAALILFTGHWGGKLTHGEDYLLQPFAKEKTAVPLNKAIAFTDMVQPIFDNKCGTCHNDGNSKGGLSLSDSAGLLRGGKTGPFLVASDPANSLFIQRVLLPAGNKKHMSPASKPQLTDEEFQLLYAWVKSGAPLNKKIIDLPEQDSFRLLAAHSLQPAEDQGQPTYSFAAADDKLIRSLNNNYRVVTPLNLRSPALQVLFYGAKVYKSKSLEEMLSVKQQIIDLSLAKMPVKNEELKTIRQMPNLQRLNLNYTDISDTGISYLLQLPNLREIALSGTPVSASGLEQLVKIPSMRTVFVWNTHIDSTRIASLRRQYKKVTIETGFADDGQDLLPLNPPVVQSKSGVYDSSFQLVLSHPMKGVEIRYTTDGSEPDSLNSEVYHAPLNITSFTVVKAKAFKPKWYGSKTLKAVYFMKGMKPDSVSLVSKDDEVKAKATLLFDKETGDGNKDSGKWLNIRKLTSCYIFFHDPVLLHKLTATMLVNNRSAISPPEKMEIWGGMDKNNLRLMKTWKSDYTIKEGEIDILQPEIDFASTSLRCIELVVQPQKNKNEEMRTFFSELILQ